jgi:predicted DCC family thiol-disulfide oxidoreductase YuxK
VNPVLLYDGACGFCAASVQWILRHDRRGTLRFAALQGEYGAAVRSRHAELAGIDSMVWVDPATAQEPERISIRSAAALRMAQYLGGIWRLTLVGGALPRRLRDAAYDFVARHRHSLPGTRDTCLVPGPDVRARFLE